jgi:hypothetical protein
MFDICRIQHESVAHSNRANPLLVGVAQGLIESGRPVAGDPNIFVRKLADDAVIYAELQEVLRKSGLDIEVVAVGKVLVARAGQLPFREPLLNRGVQPAERLPYDCLVPPPSKSGRGWRPASRLYDCIAWFSISKPAIK